MGLIFLGAGWDFTSVLRLYDVPSHPLPSGDCPLCKRPHRSKEAAEPRGPKSGDALGETNGQVDSASW